MPFWRKSAEVLEEEERLHWERIAAFEDELLSLAPASLAGDTRQPLCYSHHVLCLDEEGLLEEARRLLEEALNVCQTDAPLRFIAASFYEKWGDFDEALIQLGIVTAINPTNFNAHKRMARLVTSRGQETLARHLLDQGWVHYAKLLPRQERETTRLRYFNLSRPPAAPGTDYACQNSRVD